MKILKKLLILILLTLLTILGYAGDLKIVDAPKPDKIYGCEYFPLFVGAKWKWEAKGYGSILEINWEIVSAHKIDMPSKNLTNVLAFKIISKELFDQWYIFEYDGYVCFFNEFTETLERKLPLSPKLEDRWENANEKYYVAEIKDDLIKVEFADKNGTRYGYEMYKKWIGPYKKFENISTDKEKRDYLITLIESNTFDKKVFAEKTQDKIEENSTPKETELTKKQPEKEETLKETKSDEIVKIQQLPAEKESKNITASELNKIEKKDEFVGFKDSDKINELKKDTLYVQVGAFNIAYYAFETLNKCKELGYETKVYKDIDGLYKVLIIIKNMNEIDKIRSKINKDAFIKKAK